jgi:hypothetical protein
MKERTKPMFSSATAQSREPGGETKRAPAAFPVTPENFWSVFSDSLKLEWIDPKKRLPVLFNNSQAWTNYITGFLKGLSSRFSCISDTECWPRIDVGYFDKVGAEWDEWALEVAIEHENEVNWNEKLSKLLMISAGLKVLVAYSDNPDRILGLLNRFVEIHDSRKYLYSNSGWLFIFGPRFYPAKRDFDAYTFNGTAIVEITGGRRTIL